MRCDEPVPLVPASPRRSKQRLGHPADYAAGTAATSPIAKYLWGSYIDELVCRTAGSQKLYPHRNQQYSTVALTDQTGAVVERYTYTPYGDLVTLDPTTFAVRISAPMSQYTYTGREYDSETGSYHFRARLYLPTLGRFPSHDPIMYPDGANTYAGWFSISATDSSGTRCTINICSTPVVPGAGHLFLWVDGKAYRAGPSNTGPGNVNDFPIKPNPKCPCGTSSWGQLIGHTGDFDETFPDHPENGKGYPIDKMRCNSWVEEDKTCEELQGCFQRVAEKLYDCCIPYDPVPDLLQKDGNSNSFVAWALMRCIGTNKPSEYFRKDWRLNPGSRKPLPDCLKGVQ